MNYSSRFFLWAPFAFLLVLALAVSARWWSAASELSKRLDAMNGHQVMPGVTIRFAAKSIGGFPFNVDALLHNLEVTVAGPHGPIAWRTENFAGHALTFGRSQWILEAAGKQRLSWTTKDNKPKGLNFVIAALHASAVYTDDVLSRFDLDIVGFDSAALAIARTQLHVRHNADQLDLVANVDELHLSPPLRGACGQQVDRLRLDGNFSNAAAFDTARKGLARWQAGFDAWQKAGGRFYVAQGEFACGESSAFIQGQLGLDAEKRPRGTLTTQIAGFAALREGVTHYGANGVFITNLLNQPSDPNPEKEGRVTVRAAFRDGISYLGNAPAGMNDPLY